MKCSVIILNWNGAEMLRRYLPSVVEHTKEQDVEIIVADNGSTDESLEVMKSFETVRVIRFDRNYGFAEGYNKAINLVDSDYTVLLNSDVEVTDGWLSQLLSYMDQHPETAAVQPKIRAWLHKDKFEHAGAAGGFMDYLGYPFCRGRIMNHVEEDKGQYDSIIPIFWATGACLCVRTQIYKESGGLDGRFFAHMEEIDLCWRMNCRGYQLACIPQSVVYHLGGGALNYENPRKTFLNFRNSLLMLYKNLPANRLNGVMIKRFAMDCVAALQFLVSGKGKNAKAVIEARHEYRRLKKDPYFINLRKENMEKALIPYPALLYSRSIVFDFYLRGRKTF